MGNLFHVLLIPISILAAAFYLKSSGSAIYRKSVDFKNLDENVQAEIEKSFQKTLARLSDFDMNLPAKIMILRKENEEGNTFNDPFLVGNSHEVRAYHYVSEPVSEWCSGVVSQYTRNYIVHKNRRIDVTFDCDRKMIFPPLRTVIGYILVIFFINAVIIVLRILAPNLECHMSRMSGKDVDLFIAAAEPSTKLISSFDDYISDDEIDDLMFMDGAEKWDASKLESCYD